ncbi:integrase [Rhodococcus sp. IEGM 1374]|uniref:integrase n=1 Tax=Rhodococcus sp. IEGM 1374 TaxID=3082221 RepID=UPI00295354C4|nr:integrase [Rhodococcus sp. IEGM 1374]MDV7991590.1 integrase [Rhodococcus sp. IEGM 1374]
MALVEDPQSIGFVSRMLELTSTDTPWNRRLWRSSTLRLAQEVLDECVNPDLPESALKDIKSHFEQAMGTDPGIADRGKSVKKHLNDIKGGVSSASHSWIALEAHLKRMHLDYLTNWASEFENGRPVEVEGAARRITAHILDAGYHKSSLYTWIRALQKESDDTTVADFLRAAGGRLALPERDFTFCVPISTIPPFVVAGGASPGWLSAQETREWKKSHAPNADSIRHQGAILLTVKARDINGAVDRVRAQIFDLQTKFELGARHPIRICDRMWSKDKKNAYGTQATDRIIEVRTFELSGGIRELTTPDFIVSALALVQPLRTSPPHIAVMSGWSAIESLLVGVGDHPDVLAAGRFATIVAASMIRAEFTQLAWTYAEQFDDAVATQIKGCADNVDRAKLFQMRACSSDIVFTRETDNLALKRIKPALGDPRGALEKAQNILRREFVRLYRKRNLIAHAGQTQEQTLHSTTETVSPLIGAGVDRVVYVGLKFGMKPIQLSAMLDARIPYLTPASASEPGNLLDLFEFA